MACSLLNSAEQSGRNDLHKPLTRIRASETSVQPMMRHYLRRLIPYVGPYWHMAIASLLLMIGASLVGLLAPWPLQILVDSVIGHAPLPKVLERVMGPYASHQLFVLLLVVLGSLLIAVLTSALNVVNSAVDTKLEQLVILDFRSDLFRHAERLSVAYRDQISAARLMYGINFEAAAAGSLIMALQPLAQAGLTIFGMIWISFRIDAALALLSITIVPLLYYALRYYATHIQARLLEVKGLEADSLTIVHDAISMLPIVAAFQREDHELDRFRSQSLRAVNARVDVTISQTLFSLAVTTTTALGTALVLGLGAYHAIQGKVSAGELLVVLSYIASVYKPLETISYTLGSLQDRFVGLRMAFHVLDTAPVVDEAVNARELGRAAGHVRFDNVHFHYPGRQGTLNAISFDVLPGQVVAIIGPTGAGKTTLMNLIPRFYDPEVGNIAIDGRDIRTVTLESLRRNVSLVSQEPLLFSSTIGENIRYGRLDATDEEVAEAAKAANAHDFIMRLPGGYGAPVGDRGVRLSGGERQRLCVARAFLKNAPILILDEPTSSIDSKTEAQILDALDQLMVGRTTFMIAHRLSTVRHADLIVVLDRGQLIELGTHDQLMAQNGLYQQLYDVQTKQRVRRTTAPLLVAPEGATA